MAADTVPAAPAPAASPRHHAREMSPARLTLSPEDLMAQYERKKELGRGAHGVVYRAVRIDGQQFALKIRRKADATPASLHYNRKEGELLTRVLRHENIVQGYEYFETKDSAALVLEVADAGDLLELVNRRLGMSELEASLVALQLISALQYSHALGYVHGDVKLENILILPANDDQKIRFATEQRFALCDWGFAHKHVPGEVSERKIGSLRYQAPEMFTIQDCSPAADIWALGVVLYALVCAVLPFDGKSGSEIADKIKRSKFTFPNERGSAEFRALITAMLATDPRARLTLDQVRDSAWFAGARRLLQRLRAAASPPGSPLSSSRSNSGALSVSASAARMTASAPSSGSFAQPAAPHSQPSAGGASPQRTHSTSPPVLMPLAVKTPVALPPTEICTSPPPPPLSPLASRRQNELPKHTSACWYMPDD